MRRGSVPRSVMLRRRWTRGRAPPPRLPRRRPSPRRAIRRTRRRPSRRRRRTRNKSPLPIVDGDPAGGRSAMDPLSTTVVDQPVRKAPRSLAGLPLGEIMLAHGAISREKLAEGLAAQAERGGRLGEALISVKACSEEQVLKALAAQLELPYQMRLG